MRFGVLLLSAQFPGRTHTQVLDGTVATAVAAEDAGFDDVWIAEHHFMSYGVCPSAITLAGYLLGATRRIVVGTTVTVLTIHHPVALAEQALLLDQVSRGRFRLGVGRGQLDRTGAGRGDDHVGPRTGAWPGHQVDLGEPKRRAGASYRAAVQPGEQQVEGLGQAGVVPTAAPTDDPIAPATPMSTPICCAGSIPSARPSGAATGWPVPPPGPASGT